MSTLQSSSHIKGMVLLTIHTLLKQQEEGTTERFLAQLSPANRTVFESATATQWIPSQTAATFYAAAAPLLFPNHTDDIEQLGRALAQNALGGLYKSILAITSVTFLIKRTPLVWTLYHSTGKAEIILTPGRHQGRMVVRQAADMPHIILRSVSGFSLHALEMAGGHSVTCQLNTENPDAWEWLFDWLA